MAKLTAAARKSLTKKDFAEPRDRKFPIPDRSHAANAKARASQQEKRGNLSKSEESKIDRAADRVLGKTKEK